MATRLIPCPSCARHVRTSDASCPFCGAATVQAPAPLVARGRLSRAALLAVGAAGALAAADCGGSTSSPEPASDASAADDASSGSTSSGSTSSGSSSGAESSGSSSSGSLIALYGGLMPVDAGADAGGHMAEPVYGAVAPPHDAGADSDDAGDGGFHGIPIYGAAPSPIGNKSPETARGGREAT